MSPEIRARLEEWVREMGPAELADAVDSGQLEWWMAERVGTLEVRLVSSELARALEGWGAESPSAAGERWGEWKDGQLRPSLEAAVRLGGGTKRGRIVLTEEGAKAFLYGRDIGRDRIRSIDGQLRPEAIAIVCDPNGDVLGLAVLKNPADDSRFGLRAMKDLGWYLREGG